MPHLSEISPAVKSIKVSKQDDLEKRAEEINAEIQQGLKKPYKEVIYVTSGDSHSMGLKPITFARQVLAACIYTPLLHEDTFPRDVRERAEKILRECDGESIGSYSDSCGIKKIQHSVSEFISRRDGVASDSDNIIITNGSQSALMMLLKLLVTSEGRLPTGVVTPVPSYSSFTSAVEAQGAVCVPYYLCEDQGWSVQVSELRRALRAAMGRCNPMVLYLINPGNPTGQVQSKDSIKDVICFAAEEKLFLLVDEVYQTSVYGEGCEFYSYKRVLSEMGPPYCGNVELASFNSISKGVMGECGLRGGYMELVNVDPLVMQYAHELFSITSSPSVPAQIALDVLVDPPQAGQPSYDLYTREVQLIKSTVINNRRMALKVFSDLPALTCQPPQGGMYAFPRLHLSQAAIKHAKVCVKCKAPKIATKSLGASTFPFLKERELEPDVLYSLRLLEDTGLCVSTGSLYGQTMGKYHIRLSLAAREETMKEVLRRLKSFHLRFMKEFP